MIQWIRPLSSKRSENGTKNYFLKVGSIGFSTTLEFTTIYEQQQENQNLSFESLLVRKCCLPFGWRQLKELLFFFSCFISTKCLSGAKDNQTFFPFLGAASLQKIYSHFLQIKLMKTCVRILLLLVGLPLFFTKTWVCDQGSKVTNWCSPCSTSNCSWVESFPCFITYLILVGMSHSSWLKITDSIKFPHSVSSLVSLAIHCVD